MNILITGGYGQLGSEFMHLSKESVHKFIFVNSKECNIQEASILEKWIIDNSIDCIINCAAYTAVDLAEENEKEAFDVNYVGVKNINDLSLKYDLKFIHISTDYVFDGKKNTPYATTDPTNPIGIYGKSKRMGEEVIINSNSNSIIIRTSWLYSSFANNFTKTMLRLGKERSVLNVVADQFGSPTYARELATAILYIIDIKKSFTDIEKIYHYSNEGSTNWSSFARAIFNTANIDCIVNDITTDQYPTKAERPKYSILDSSKITEVFGVSTRKWEEALLDCILAIEKEI